MNKKTFAERIGDLQKELTAEIIRLIKLTNLESISIPPEIDEKVYVLWIDNDGFAQDSEVLKIGLYGNGIHIEVEDANSFHNIDLYSGNDIALEHVEWLEQLRALLDELLNSGSWRLCSQCLKFIEADSECDCSED